MPDNLETVVRTMDQRPAAMPDPLPIPIPADAFICNGPQLLHGSRVNGVALCWLGEALEPSGAHYAAIIPDDPNAGDLRQLNRAAGAVWVEYVTAKQVRAALRKCYEGLGWNADEITVMVDRASDRMVWLQYMAESLLVSQVAF